MQRAGARKPYRRRLRTDPNFFFELQFCYEQGIPHSKFLKKWGPVDKAKMTAYVAEKAERCALCGTAPWEWDPRQGGNRRAYTAVEHFCPGCYAKASLQNGDPGRNMDGITIELVPNDRSLASAQRRVKQRRLSGAGAPRPRQVRPRAVR